MLYLSASSIKDWLQCKRRYWYRTNEKQATLDNDNLIFGNIVHEAIEKHTNAEDAIRWAWIMWKRRYSTDFMTVVDDTVLPPKGKSFERMLGNYYSIIEPQLGLRELDQIEHFFKIPWNEHVTIVGKIDRISGFNIYDWKTGLREPSQYVLQDLQFYLYEWAFHKEHGQSPQMYYGHLATGELFNIKYHSALQRSLISVINDVYMDIITRSTAESFPRNTGYQCSSCFYKGICFKHLEDGI